MADFTIKKGDLLPPLDAILKDANGKAVDLTAASGGVKFSMIASDSDTPKISCVTAGVPSAESGQVQYLWTGTDTDVVGKYFGEFEVDWGTKKQTFPNKGFITIEIVEDIA